MLLKLVLLFCCSFCVCVKLPNYIETCKRGPDFGSCALRSAKLAIPHLVKGDKSLKIPNMLPLKVPLIHIKSGNLDMKIRDVEIYGLETIEPVKLDFDFEKKTGTTFTRAHKLILLGNYEVNGKISVLPIEGRGPLNITLIDGTYDYKVLWQLEKKNGVDYVRNLDGKFNFNLQRIHFYLGNLFNGNEMLGDQVNKFLNESWREALDEFRDPISKTMHLIYGNIAKNIYTRLPYKDLFRE